MDMEAQAQQPWEEEKVEEEEEKETALIGRKSKKPPPPPVNDEVNGGKLHIHLDEEDNAANNSHKNSVYFDNNQGNGSVDGTYTGFESSVLETNFKNEEIHFEANNFDIEGILSTEINHQDHKDYFLEINSKDDEMHFEANNFDETLLSTEINHHNHKDSVDEIFSCSTPSPVNILSEEKSKNLEHLDDKTGVDTDVELLDEFDQESIAIEVERVLENQNTHDLYCPNCNSCITRRVILRRRKPKVRNIRLKSKQDKGDKYSAATVTTDQSDNTHNICSNDSPTPATDDENHDRQPDAFRCLSCFSIFIRGGNGFKPFHVFGDSDENGEVQNVQNIPPSKKNWFFSIFASDKRKSTADKDNNAPAHSEVYGINQHTSSHCSENTLPYHGSDHPMEPLGGTNSVKTRDPVEDSHIKSQLGNRAPEHSEPDGITQQISSRCPENIPPYHGSDHPAAPLGVTDHVKTRDPAEDSHIKSQQGSGEPEHSEVDGINQPTLSPCPGNMHPCHGSDHPVAPLGDTKPVKTRAPAEDWIGDDVVVTIKTEPAPAEVVSSQRAQTVDSPVDTDDVVVTIKTEPAPAEVVSSQRAQNVDSPVDTGILPQAETQVGDNRGPEATESRQWDILKSIVYGGLFESIASLGVVTSAAAAGTATMDILAMGLANLMGGLLIVAHNLRELKNDHAEETSTRTNKQEGRYQQLLGRRENFSLHATLVILSYLIFGLMPPVIYGFTFHKSDSRDLKIAAVAGSSLACIIVLAVAKVHSQRPPRSYMKTVLYYVTIGLTTSGLSYVAGDLIKQLLEKLNSSSLEANSMNPGWASY